MSGLPDSPAGEAEGFQFPGLFDVTVMGDADIDLLALIDAELKRHALERVHRDPAEKRSSGGRFRSVSASFMCGSREKLESLHQSLREHPAVKWIL